MLYDKIKGLGSIPFHTPGHKRNTELLGDCFPYSLDITEIKGFDNLHSPDGVLLDLNQRLNKLYDAKKSYVLVNGSTVGILSAVNAVISEGDTVLMSRNCHKSVYNAVEIAKAQAEYIMPDYDRYGISKGITAKQLRDKLGDDIKLVIITSPTYEGVESEVEAICELAHKRGVPVLIDAAHGAHFFEKYHNADIVIRSMHKTLPALTQCSVANIYGNLVDSKQFEIKLSVFETSSPSYVLLSSAEKCVEFINNNTFDGYYKNLIEFYDADFHNLKLLKYDDIAKIVIFTGYTDITGYELADMLRNNNIEPEMASQYYVILLSTVCDKPENLDILKEVLKKIDNGLTQSQFIPNMINELPPKYCNAFETNNAFEMCLLSKCVGKVSAEYIWAYPPGVPIIVPGEIITNQIIKYINAHSSTDFKSTYGFLPHKICCKKV